MSDAQIGLANAKLITSSGIARILCQGGPSALLGEATDYLLAAARAIWVRRFIAQSKRRIYERTERVDINIFME